MYFSVSDREEMLTVGGFSVSLCRFEKLLLVYPAVLVRDFLDGGNLYTLTLFDHLDKCGSFDEAVHCACIKPCKASAEKLDIKLSEDVITTAIVE